MSTCNRVEVYAEVDRFHGGVSWICELLSRHAGIALGELTPNLYVHYEDRAVQHLLAVASGLESMVVGEDQILGQVRRALPLAGEQGTLGRGLGELGSLALRTAGGRQPRPGSTGRARAWSASGSSRSRSAGWTAADAIGRFAAARPQPGGQRPRATAPPAGGRSPAARRAAGARGRGRLDELAGRRHRGQDGRRPARGGQPDQRPRRAAGGNGLGHRGRPVPAGRPEIAAADLVVSCTGAPGHVITRDTGRGGARVARATGRPLILLDLALPRDVDPGAAGNFRA